jgi:hypothetical protein
MANVNTIHGFDQVMIKINAGLALIKGGTAAGLIKAAAFVRKDMETTPPLTPVDLGNLKASFFAVTAKKVAHGSGIARFNGPKAGLLASEHLAATAEMKALAGKDKSKITLILGYTANYALYVHENIKARKWKKPGSGPKWFQYAMDRNSKKIIRIVADNAKI